MPWYGSSNYHRNEWFVSDSRAGRNGLIIIFVDNTMQEDTAQDSIAVCFVFDVLLCRVKKEFPFCEGVWNCRTMVDAIR